MLKSLFDTNEKQIKTARKVAEAVNNLEPEIQALSQEALREQTLAWIQQLATLDKNGQKTYLEEILPKAFAVVRESSIRSLEKRHFDVQLIAGVVLHQGKIAEQKTGEGKTLTATLPLYLNALTGRGVHLVTPNDYLSRHGAGWMGPVYNYLGLKVGAIVQERAFVYDPNFENTEFQDEYAKHMREVSRKEAYQCHITYGTNHEFGFDYLRDNMSRHVEDIVQTNPNGEFGAHAFAIVDEVDSILIDVARTPLIISTSAYRASERYVQANDIVKNLMKGQDFEADEKFRSSSLTDLGIRRVERMLNIKNLYEQDYEMVHLLEQALTATALFEKDKDYVIKEGKVVIVDQFTGRLLPSNRYSNGLHQAIEAKEHVEIQQESKTLAEISYQNYFRMYEKLAGMTGTAETEAEEFYKIYKLDVVVIPTNKPSSRKDQNDAVYQTESAKFRAVAEEVVKRHAAGQPVLIGTTSVEKNQIVHELLKRKGVPHELLNAKNHEREALIISQAGKRGAVTVATNMAGRGVDIILGGDPFDERLQEEVKTLGGLHVMGTERHESRRIDNQLRGRSGRQGDPGSSRFFISLQDDLMRIFGGDQMKRLMDKFGMEENMPLEAGLVSKAIENAQKRVEGFNFDSRKRLVEMDDVINAHRNLVYGLRSIILSLSKLTDITSKELPIEIEEAYVNYLGKVAQNTNFDVAVWEENFEKFGKRNCLLYAAQVGLRVIDLNWMDHLVDMESLRESIGLSGYAQRDPMVEYKREGRERFSMLIDKIYAEIAQGLQNITSGFETPTNKLGTAVPAQDIDYSYADDSSSTYDSAQTVYGSNEPRFKVEEVKSTQKLGRNDLCHCGSGKKFKNCHGR